MKLLPVIIIGAASLLTAFSADAQNMRIKCGKDGIGLSFGNNPRNHRNTYQFGPRYFNRPFFYEDGPKGRFKLHKHHYFGEIYALPEPAERPDDEADDWNDEWSEDDGFYYEEPSFIRFKSAAPSSVNVK